MAVITLPGLALLLCFTLISTLSLKASAQTITFMTHNVEGSYYRDENGQLRGFMHAGRRAFNIELIREMMQIMQHPMEITILPFKRAEALIKENQHPYALFNIGKRASRNGLMKWVGPLQIDPIYFYENSAKPTNIRSISDAKKVAAICTLNGSSHQRLLRQEGFENLTSNISYQGCFKMLAEERAELTIISQHSLKEVLIGAAIPSTMIRNTSVILHSSEGQLAFSNQVSDETVALWQQALDQIKRSGRYDELVRDYLE